MTPQFEILTGMRVCSNIYLHKGKQYLTNDINPFYKASLIEVKNNFEYAKEIYWKVWIRFQNACYRYREEFGKGEIPPKRWEVLKI